MTQPTGWIPYVDRSRSQQMQTDEFHEQIPSFSGRILPYDELPELVYHPAMCRKATGKRMYRSWQVTGSCVGSGSSVAQYIANCGDIVHRGTTEEVRPLWWLATYGKGRQIAGMRRKGSGSYGAAQAKAVEEFGTLSLANDVLDLPQPTVHDECWFKFTSQQETSWSLPPWPLPESAVKVEAEQHQITTVTRITNKEQLLNLLAQGYGCTIASSFGSRRMSVKNGILMAPHNGSWAHQMCCSQDTDVLTLRGWVSSPDVREDDLIATLNQDTQKVEYQRPTALHNYDYEGPMCHFETSKLDLLVTPNHRIYSANKSSQKYCFHEAQEVGGWRSMLQGSGGMEGGKDPETYRLSDDHSVGMDDWLLFLGIWIAEGTVYERVFEQEYAFHGQEPTTATRRQGYVCLTQSKPDDVRFIDDLLDRFGGKWTRSVDDRGIVQWRCYGKYIRDHLKPFGKQHTRYVPDYVFELSQAKQKLLLDAMWRGDGSGRRYYTCSKRLADDVTRLLINQGHNSRVVKHKNGHLGKRQLYAVVRYEAKSTCCSDGSSWSRKEVDYKGRVYCVTVPNQVFYARRKGKACWTGNSVTGYWKHPQNGLILFIANQWGPTAHPECPFQFGEHECNGAFAVYESTIDYMLRNELYGHADTEGWPLRELDWDEWVWDLDWGD